MAIVPKSALLQVRLDPRLLERFKAVCEQTETKHTHALRVLLETYVVHAEHRLQKAATSASGVIERAAGTSVTPKPQKPPVEPPVRSVVRQLTVSERLKAERDAKKAKKKRREDRWFKD